MLYKLANLHRSPLPRWTVPDSAWRHSFFKFLWYTIVFSITQHHQLTSPALLVTLVESTIGSSLVPSPSSTADVELQHASMSRPKAPSSRRRKSINMRLRPAVQVEVWKQKTDKSTGRVYYVNKTTKESAWELPEGTIYLYSLIFAFLFHPLSSLLFYSLSLSLLLYHLFYPIFFLLLPCSLTMFS